MQTPSFKESCARFEQSWQKDLFQQIEEAQKILSTLSLNNASYDLLKEYIALLKKELSLGVFSKHFTEEEKKKIEDLEKVLIQKNILTYNIIDIPERNSSMFSIINNIKHWIDSAVKHY